MTAAMVLPQLPGILLEQAPGLFAVLRLPVAVEAGLGQGRAERLTIDVEEGDALGLEIVPQRHRQLGDVGTLIRGGTVELLFHDGPQVGRQTLPGARSEEHTSELQSPLNLVCRLL